MKVLGELTIFLIDFEIALIQREKIVFKVEMVHPPRSRNLVAI